MHFLRGFSEGFPRLYPFIQDVQCVQEHDKHAVARIGCGLNSVALRVRLHSFGLGPRRTNDDVLEGFDLLEDVVFENLEVLGAQSQDRRACLGRIGIYPDEIRLDPKFRWLLRRILWRSRLRRGKKDGGGREREAAE
jgi:hypothetical protein